MYSKINVFSKAYENEDQSYGLSAGCSWDRKVWHATDLETSAARHRFYSDAEALYDSKSLLRPHQ